MLADKAEEKAKREMESAAASGTATGAAPAPGPTRRFGPVWTAAALYTLITLAMLFAAWRAADRHFVYPLDDTYIGMAMAKNLALHSVWGITRYAFSSSDSSLLFPLLLAGSYRVLGINEYAPLVLSWTFGLLAIFAAGRILSRFLDDRHQRIALICLVLLPPLFVTGLLGMEHSLHILLTLLFLGYFLAGPDGSRSSPTLWQIGTITALMVATRYEGLFFVAPACCILAAARRWKAALAMAFSAAIPVAAYAAYSLAHGGYWLPNSVALKGAHAGHGSVFGAAHDVLLRVGKNAGEGIHLPILLAGVALAAILVLRRSSRTAIPLLLVLVAGCLHLCLASLGVGFRYDDYLIAATVVTVACAWPALREMRTSRLYPAVSVWLLVAGATLLFRSASAANLLPRCSRSIYSQQWQMAHFLRENYPQATVAANDIGAIDYFADIHCFDLVGLANREIFFARRSGGYTTQFLGAQVSANHVQIAILYDDWFADPPPGTMGGPKLPSGWVRVGRWTILDHAVLVEKTVSFYAVDPAEADGLRSALRRFAGELPANVEETAE